MLEHRNETEGRQEVTHQWNEVCVAGGTQNRRPAGGETWTNVDRRSRRRVGWRATERRTSKREIPVNALGDEGLEGQGQRKGQYRGWIFRYIADEPVSVRESSKSDQDLEVSRRP
jgi:hypothetical protein